MKRSGMLAVLMTFALTLPGVVEAAPGTPTIDFDLVPVAACVSNATGHVTVALREETKGVDTLQLTTRGLPADTDFAVFLTSSDAFASPPFGAVQYIGDFTTNAAGDGKLKVEAIIAEAFVSTRVDGTRVRADVDHLVFWFADPAQAQAACGIESVTPFDGDGNAGTAAMSSQGATGLEQFPE